MNKLDHSYEDSKDSGEAGSYEDQAGETNEEASQATHKVKDSKDDLCLLICLQNRLQ